MKKIVAILFVIFSGMTLYGQTITDLSRNLNRSQGTLAVLKPTGKITNSGSYSSASENNTSSFAYFGIGVITGGLLISISNDLYIYPIYSFYRGNRSYSDYIRGSGWGFGFRKTFRHSAIEYGLSCITFSERFLTGSTTTTAKVYPFMKVGFHINYVQQLFYNLSPMNLYVGPTINLIEGFGYGGIIGTEIRLHESLKFDFRYEYSTATDQIQAGLIFTFHKKSFWKK